MNSNLMWPEGCLGPVLTPTVGTWAFGLHPHPMTNLGAVLIEDSPHIGVAFVGLG